MLSLLSYLLVLLLLIAFVRRSWMFVIHLLLGCCFLFSFMWGENLFLFSPMSCGVFFLDGISLNLVLLSIWTTLLMMIGSFYLTKKELSSSLFSGVCVSLLIILATCFLVKSVLTFYVFFELSLIPTFFLIMKWGYQPERIQASLYMMLYTVCASLPLLLTILFFSTKGFSLNFSSFFLPYFDLYENFVWSFFLMIAFFVKMPLYFTHLWLPKAHVEAPVAGSMVLAGVLLKLGSYGLLRVMKMWSTLLFKFSEVFVTVSLVGGVLTSIICVAQSDLKSLIAYSSIGHMGILTAGVLSMSTLGALGALIMMVAHGLCSSGMFFLSNTFYQNSKSRSVLLNKGILFVFPFAVMWSFLLFSCNMAAPPSINLAGELMLCMGVLSFSFSACVAIGLMTFLACAYSMYLYTLSCHGAAWKSFSTWKEMKDYDILCMALHLLPIWLIILNLKMYV